MKNTKKRIRKTKLAKTEAKMIKKDFFGAFKGMRPFTEKDELDTELE